MHNAIYKFYNLYRICHDGVIWVLNMFLKMWIMENIGLNFWMIS